MKNYISHLAHQVSATDTYRLEEDLEHVISGLSMNSVIWGSALLVVLLTLAALTRDRLPTLKKPLFFLSAFTVVLVTAIIVSSTIYLNVKSSSGGPVHWHADFEIWACGQEMELRDPTGWLSNKIGTSTYHEHDDKRIHLEGVVVEEQDASLGKFFAVTDGSITENTMVVALNDPAAYEGEGSPYFEDETDGQVSQATRNFIENKYIDADEHGTYASFVDGQTCDDGTRADVQVFAYRIKKDDQGKPVTVTDQGIEKTVYTQEKLSDPASYVITDDSVVPPGDCLIFEFAPIKAFTDKKCLQYEVHGDELNKYFYEEPVVEEETPAAIDTPALDGEATASPSADPGAETCADYLENKDDPAYRPGLTEEEIAICNERQGLQ